MQGACLWCWYPMGELALGMGIPSESCHSQVTAAGQHQLLWPWLGSPSPLLLTISSTHPCRSSFPLSFKDPIEALPGLASSTLCLSFLPFSPPPLHCPLPIFLPSSCLPLLSPPATALPAAYICLYCLCVCWPHLLTSPSSHFFFDLLLEEAFPLSSDSSICLLLSSLCPLGLGCISWLWSLMTPGVIVGQHHS